MLKIIEPVLNFINQIIGQNYNCFVIISIIVVVVIILYIFIIGKEYNETDQKEENIFYKDIKDIFIASIPFIIIMSYSGQLINNNKYGYILLFISSIVSLIILIITFIYSYELFKKYKNNTGIKIIKIAFILVFMIYYLLGVTISVKNINPGNKVCNNDKVNIYNIEKILSNQQEIKKMLIMNNK